MDILHHIFAFDPNSPLLFTQFYFWAFFAIVYTVFTLIHLGRQDQHVRARLLMRNAFLFLVSAFFYYKTSGLFLLILLFVTCSDFLIAKRIHASDGRRAKAWLTLSVVIDLGLLFYFKYAYFLTNLLTDLTGIECRVFDIFAYIGNGCTTSGRFDVNRIILPVGISFYIFQVISYTADVYRRKIHPVSNILDFGFYVSFFPQLVAGPIVRASDFVPQLYKPFHLSRRQMGIAVFWILNGLMKKLILSDYLAVNFIDRVFENPLLFSGFENLMALFVYSLQVYADFSGYTDIAIGVAMLMGFYLPTNFHSPYKAHNAQEFWRRWHMSLSGWLKSYLYIPLGGNRTAFFGLAKNPDHRLLYANINSMLTMLLGGLWHGASWNFVIWGGLNGIGMIIYKVWKKQSWKVRMLVLTLTLGGLLTIRHFYPAPVWNLFCVWLSIIWCVSCVRALWSLFKFSNLHIYTFTHLQTVWAVMQTFTFITFTRLFFRSGSNLDPATANQEAWQTAKNMVNQIGSAWNLSIIPDICAEYWRVFGLFALGMIIHWLPERWKRRYRLWFASMPLPLMALAVVLVVFIVYQFITADLQAFIYFQF